MPHSFLHFTMGQNNQELRLKYWATRSSNRLFARTTHLLSYSTLLALLACSIALTRSLAHFAHSLARGKVNDYMAIYSVFFLFSTIVKRGIERAVHANEWTSGRANGPALYASLSQLFYPTSNELIPPSPIVVSALLLLLLLVNILVLLSLVMLVLSLSHSG